MAELQLPKGRGENRRRQLINFANNLIDIYTQIGFELSARGWCYQLEGFRLVNKNQFDRVEKLINECRREGHLPVDFTAEEEARKFRGVEIPEDCTPIEYLQRYLVAAMNCGVYYTPDWWTDETYYIQILVEKVDLKTLFEPVCKKFHIPIATSKGWSSIFQRAEFARRFKDAEEKGLICVLLYCGDHDPDGLRITENIRKNLYDVKDVWWIDETTGYNPGGKIYDNGVLISDTPEKLIIDRFGLNYDFIIEYNLTWIDNLITSSGKDLAGPSHRNHHLPYVQNYLKQFGPKKCEANALVIIPDEARKLCKAAIEKYLGNDALKRFDAKRQEVRDNLDEFKRRTGLDKTIMNVIKAIKTELGANDKKDVDVN